MRLAFDTENLRSLCEDKQKAMKVLGKNSAIIFFRRLADLKAAKTVSDLIIGNPQLIDNNYFLSFGENCQIVFCSNHSTGHKDTEGNINWSKVTRIKITGVSYV